MRFSKTDVKSNMNYYKGYCINTECGTEKGIFFRNPLQKVTFDAYYTERVTNNAWKYLSDIQNPIRRIYEILIGNLEIVKNINDWSKDDIHWGGFTANILCFPIYFNREYRQLVATSTNPDHSFQEIHSYGYESSFNICLGECEKETTLIKLKNGKKLKFNVRDKYNYTYLFKIQKLIDEEETAL